MTPHRPVIIIGMHRSGTSMITTRVLERQGLSAELSSLKAAGYWGLRGLLAHPKTMPLVKGGGRTVCESCP